MKAIIMAGGTGERMLPLTCRIPKPMMPVVNTPLLEHIVVFLKKCGIKDIGITLMYLSNTIKNYFSDGSKWGVNITYFTEKTPLGTAGSILNAASFYSDTFVVISGDCITDFDISEAVEFHKCRKAMATIVLKEVRNPVNFGIADLDSRCRIKSFLEKPKVDEIFSNLTNTGIYVLEPGVFEHIEHKYPLDFSMHVFPSMIQKKLPLFGYKTCSYWSDVGTLSSYIVTHRDILNGKINLPGNTFNDNIVLGKSAIIEPTAVIKGPCVIGDKTYIGKNAVVGKYSVIGNNCIISDKASVTGCIIFDNCTVGYNSRLVNSVLGRNVHVMSDVLSYPNVIIGDNSIIYEHTVIKPDIRIWPGKTVASMSVVDKNIA